jgi:hypothetical protein
MPALFHALLGRLALRRRRLGRRDGLRLRSRRGLLGLGVGAGVGGLQIDDVAQQDLGFVEFVAPDDDGLEGERALAQALDHGLAAGLDALGDGDLAFARQQLHRAHFAQIHAHRVIGAVDRLGGALDLDGQAGPLDLFNRLLGVAFAFHHIDAHLGEHRHGVLDLFGRHLFGRQHVVEFVVGDVAALLGQLDHPLDGGVGHVEQRTVGGLRSSFRHFLVLYGFGDDLVLFGRFTHLRSRHVSDPCYLDSTECRARHPLTIRIYPAPLNRALSITQQPGSRGALAPAGEFSRDRPGTSARCLAKPIN